MSDPSLEEYLNENDGLDPEIEANNWIPNQADEQAGRALRLISHLETRIRANQATAALERSKITDWENLVNEPMQKKVAWLYSLLTKYAINERQNNPDRKTIQTPYGTLSTRPAQPTWELDEAVFLKWALVNAPELIKTTMVPKLQEAKKQLKPKDGKAYDSVSGQEVEGIKIIPASGYTASVKPQ